MIIKTFLEHKIDIKLFDISHILPIIKNKLYKIVLKQQKDDDLDYVYINHNEYNYLMPKYLGMINYINYKERINHV